MNSNFLLIFLFSMWQGLQFLTFYYGCDPKKLADKHDVLWIALRALDGLEGTHHRTYTESNDEGNVALTMKDDKYLMVSTSKDFKSLCSYFQTVEAADLKKVIEMLMQGSGANRFETINL